MKNEKIEELRLKTSSVSYTDVADSGKYVRGIRTAEGKRVKSGRKFMEELLEWQKANT